MAKGNSNRGSADGTPSSLTTLLALPEQPAIPVTLDPIQHQQLFHGNYHDPQSDLRRYDPTIRSRPPHAVNRYATRLHIGTLGTPTGHLSAHVQFREPRRVDLCVRRHTRRAVLFALNRTSKGSGAAKRRRNFYSDVKC